MAFPPEKWNGTEEETSEIENLSVVMDMDPSTRKECVDALQKDSKNQERKLLLLDIQMNKTLRHAKDKIAVENCLRCTFCKNFPSPKNYYFCTNKTEAHILCSTCFDDPSRSSPTCIAHIPLEDKEDSNSEMDGISKMRICGMTFYAAKVPVPIYDVMLKYSSFHSSDGLSKCDCSDATATEGERKDAGTSYLQNLAPNMISLGNILSHLDGVSTINLSYTSTTLNDNIRSFLSGCAGSKYWTQCSKTWFSDPQLLAVLASYDTIVGRSHLSANDVIKKESGIHFSWDYAYQAAHDVATFVRCSQIQFYSLKRLQNQIKTDISMKFGDRRNLRYDVPNRVTGTSGTLAWNVMTPEDCAPLPESNPETFFIYEDMVKCKRQLDIGQKKIHGAQVMILPRRGSRSQTEMEQDFNSSSGFTLLSRFLITIDDKRLCVVPLQEGLFFFTEEFPHFPFETSSAIYGKELYMIPKIATYENYVAVWSDPYILRVYSVHVEQDGTARMDLYSSAPNNCIPLGVLWSRWSDRQDDCDFLFSLGPRPLHRPEFSLMLSITCPIDPEYQMYQVIIPKGLNVAIENGIRVRSQNPQQDALEILTTKLEFSPGIDTLLPQVEEEILCGIKSAHGLHIYWNSNVLVASYDGLKWFSQDWIAMTLELTDHPESFDASLIEIIAPNLLALVSGENIFIAMIDIHNIKDQTVNHPKAMTSSASPSSPSSITLKLVRKISTGFFERGLAVRQLGFDYDRGTPYIWLVVDKLCVPTDVSSYKFRDKPWSFEFYRIKFVMEME